MGRAKRISKQGYKGWTISGITQTVGSASQKWDIQHSDIQQFRMYLFQQNSAKLVLCSWCVPDQGVRAVFPLMLKDATWWKHSIERPSWHTHSEHWEVKSQPDNTTAVPGRAVQVRGNGARSLWAEHSVRTGTPSAPRNGSGVSQAAK